MKRIPLLHEEPKKLTLPAPEESELTLRPPRKSRDTAIHLRVREARLRLLAGHRRRAHKVAENV
jgi:hypothetical protein